MIPPSHASYSGEGGRNHLHPLPAVIPEGQRNDTLTRLAGSMRRAGFGEAAMLAALVVENAVRCTPPLSGDEVARIAHSVARYAPAYLPTHKRASKTRARTEFVGGKVVQQ